MQRTATATACPASPDDPQPDRPGETVTTRTMPARIAALLHTVRIMLGFGRHLAATAKQRSTSSDFNAIAVCFGTGRLFKIMAHLQRGLLRATALENVLLARAARGRDIGVGAPRKHVITELTMPADPPAEQSAETPVEQPVAAPVEQPAVSADPQTEAPVARKNPRPSLPIGWDDPELFMPTLKELEAQVRRRPLGRTLVDICLDLAVVPGFCASPFLNELLDSIRLRGGSIGVLMVEKMHREQAFCKEQDRKVGSNWDWQTLTQDAVRRMLGGLIGEGADGAFDPFSQPCAPAAAVAPGPS